MCFLQNCCLVGTRQLLWGSSSGAIWSGIWSDLEPSGAIWSHLEWRSVELSGALWSCLEPSGVTWGLPIIGGPASHRCVCSCTIMYCVSWSLDWPLRHHRRMHLCSTYNHGRFVAVSIAIYLPFSAINELMNAMN